MGTRKAGRRPSLHFWGIAPPGEDVVIRRRLLSWAEAIDELDLAATGTRLVVKAGTENRSRSIKASAVKAASRRLLSLDAEWDGQYVTFTIA